MHCISFALCWFIICTTRDDSGSRLKGLFTIFLFSVRSHILNSNGVWYWWFCPEGPKNAQNSRFLGFYFVPRGPWLAAPHGTSTRSAGDLDSQRRGPRLAAKIKKLWTIPLRGIILKDWSLQDFLGELRVGGCAHVYIYVYICAHTLCMCMCARIHCMTVGHIVKLGMLAKD